MPSQDKKNEEGKNKTDSISSAIVAKQVLSSNNTEKEEYEREEDAEEIDLSSLSYEEKDALLIEMQAEEMQKKQLEEAGITKERKKKKRRKKRKKKEPTYAELAPGFGWVVIKMGSAMTFSMTFIFLGPILIFMALFKTFGTRGVYDWYDLLFGVIGIGLVIASWFLFRYIIKD